MGDMLHQNLPRATGIIFILAALAGVGADLVAYNLPKNLPANMSSKWVPSEVASLANNGNTAGSYVSGSQCIHTGPDDNQPWWMLDMQSVRLISGVRVWNRVNCCSNEFTAISIGVSSNDSVWNGNFHLSLFDICYFYSGSPTSSQNPLSFSCTKPVAGRYLTVHKNATGIPVGFNVLHFCEIDVFAFVKAAPHSFRDVEPSFSDNAASSLTDPSQPPASRSFIECAIICGLHPSCLYAMQVSGHCQMFLSPVIPSSFRDAFIAGAALAGVVV